MPRWGTVYLGILYLDIVYPGFWLTFEWVPAVTVFWMGRGNEWSGEEDAALRALVGLHGCSADSARCRWKVLRALVSPVAVGVVVGMPEVFPWGGGGGGVEGLPGVVALRGRSTSGGRPWEYVVRVSRREGVRPGPTPRQARLVVNWGLGEGGLLLCSLKDAEERLRRYLVAGGVALGDLNATRYCIQLSSVMNVNDNIPVQL